MAEPPQTGIDTSPSWPSSSAPSSPPDPSDEAPPRLKSPWSQIVRGSPVSPRSKPADRASCELHPDGPAEKIHLQNPSSELRVSADRATTVNNTPVFSSAVDRRQGAHELHSEALTSSPDGLVNQAVLSQHSPAKSPKLAWGKLISNPVQSLEPEPVMGADTWPALSEARNPKALESLKAGNVQKSGPKTNSASIERHHYQASPLLQHETGARDRAEPANQSTVNCHDIPNLSVLETPSSHVAMQGTEAEQLKGSGGKGPKVATAANEASPLHARGPVTGHGNNKESSRNFVLEQGRGNNSFPAYGRGQASSREHPGPGHQQRGAQRNVPQPFVPFGNPNPGFVYPSGYQAVGGVDAPGSMYYMPAPTADPVYGATYFVQPGVFFPPPDTLLTIQGKVVKQIEYYFSIENLCRDIYLRSKMDEWGFVHVSVIANFNRVRMITQNPYLIIDALRSSNVVEVQGEKIRKKGDWANWLLPPGQPLAMTSGGKDQAARLVKSSKKAAVDHFVPKNSSFDLTDNQINGLSYLDSHVGERFEALSVTAVNIQGAQQDSQSHEEAACSLSDGGLMNLQVDGVNSKPSTQPCDLESDPGMK